MVIHDIFREYRERKAEIDISLEKMKSDLGEMAGKIVLYGAGSAGIAFLHYLRDAGIYPLYFADGNPSRWGKMCEKIPIIDYRQITLRAGEDALVIVTINTDGSKYCKSFPEQLLSGGHQGVYKNLRKAGCKHVIDYSYFRRCRDLFRGDRYNLPSCSDVMLMECNEDKICEVYSWLADEKSREVYAGLVRFRLLDDSIRIPTESQERQYFEYEFYPKRSDEVFLDCGAYNGISLKTFLRENNNSFRKYYGMEPDPDNYDKLKEYVTLLPPRVREKIVLTDKAAYGEEKEEKLYRLGGPGSFLSEIGNEKVETICIDNFVGTDKITYIKMNIEGAELEALKGADKTIKGNHPKLAIAGYHKTWDLWEVPLMIRSICPDYHFYLRSYMNHLSFVFYGI